MAQFDLFAEDSHASPGALPGSNEAKTMTVTSGQNILDSYGKLGHVGLLGRMLLASSIWDSTLCWLTWKVKATPQSRLLFQLSPSMPSTEEIESGLLHTPTAKANQMSPSMMDRDNGSWGKLMPTPTEDSANERDKPYSQGGTPLTMAVKDHLWATPNTMDHLPQRSPEALEKQATTTRKGRTRPANLREQVDEEVCRMWPTPMSRDWKGCRTVEGLMESGRNETNGLPDAVMMAEARMWPTMTVNEAKNTSLGINHQRRADKHHLTSIVYQEEGLLPTPCADDNRDRGHLGMPAVQRRQAKGKQLNLGMVADPQKKSGALNPDWVEWLMGYPSGHTSLQSPESQQESPTEPVD